MFRRSRILQAVLLALLTTACASQQPLNTANGSSPADGQAAALNNGQRSAPAVSASPNLTPAPSLPDIQAGSSEATSRPFTNEAGALDPDIEIFAQEVSELRNVPLNHVRALLLEAQYNATAARLMAPAKTRIRRSWVTYRNRFVEPIRIREGQQVWENHSRELARTESEYGVPAAIMVASSGAETLYGRHTGGFQLLDALATLGSRSPVSSRPERAHMFRNQLADLITLDHQGVLNAREATGSFAGAMGLPQFMPGSLKRYAADGDGDGRIDLHADRKSVV